MPVDEPPRESGTESVQFGSSGGPGTRWWILAVGLLLAAVVAVLVIPHGTAPDASSRRSPAASSASDGSTASDAGAVQGPAAEPNLSRIEVSWLHAKSDWTLFIRTDESVLAVRPRADRLRITAVPALQSSGPVSFVVRRGEVLIRPLDNVAAYVIPDGQPARRSGLPMGGLVYPGPLPDQLWIPDGDRKFDLVRLDGSRSGSTITIPHTVDDPLPRPDGSGHLLFIGAGGIYRADAEGIHRLSAGQVIATGPNRIVMVECHSRVLCHPSVYDQRTGAKRVVPTVLPPIAAIADGVISPDGHWMAFASGTDQPLVRLVDLRTGHQQVVSARIDGSVSGDQAIAWSPDSRWIFIAGLNGTVTAANASTGAERTLHLGLEEVQQVAVRP